MPERAHLCMGYPRGRYQLTGWVQLLPWITVMWIIRVLALTFSGHRVRSGLIRSYNYSVVNQWVFFLLLIQQILLILFAQSICFTLQSPMDFHMWWSQINRIYRGH